MRSECGQEVRVKNLFSFEASLENSSLTDVRKDLPVTSRATMHFMLFELVFINDKQKPPPLGV